MKRILLVGCLLVLSGCRTLPTEQIIAIPRSDELKTICQRHDIAWVWDGLSQVVTLKGAQEHAKVLIGSDTVFVGEQVVLLTEPVGMDESVIVIPPDFERRVIDLLKEAEADEDIRLPTRIKEIILDAGHGGKDPGAIGKSGVYEKDVVLDITKRLYKVLKNEGYKVILTRKDDTFISLQKRTEIASQNNADLFISVHANSNPSRGIHGLEVYSLRDLDVLEKNEEQRKNNHLMCFKHLTMKQDNNELKGILADMMYVHKQKETKSLAPYVAKKTSRYIRTKNRGEKKARFYVLRNTLIPALLVEVGYLTNPKEEKLLKTGAYRQKIALGLAESITEYINGEK